MIAGIVVALPFEARSLRAGVWPEGEVAELGAGGLAVRAGVGPERAKRAARLLVDNGAEVLVSWGSCTALLPGPLPGDIVISNRVISDRTMSRSGDVLADSGLIEAFRKCLSTVGCQLASGPILQVDQVLPTPAGRASAAAGTNAMFADMESGAVARIAADHGIPFLAVRVVLDPFSFSLPGPVLHAVSATGRFRAAPFLVRALISPWSWLPLLRLGRHFRTARAALARVANTRCAMDLLGVADEG